MELMFFSFGVAVSWILYKLKSEQFEDKKQPAWRRKRWSADTYEVNQKYYWYFTAGIFHQRGGPFDTKKEALNGLMNFLALSVPIEEI